MKIQLDENNYFTGNYAMVGDIENSIEIECLPEDLTENKSKAWKYENDTWTFDKEKYKTILEEVKIREEKEESIMTNEELTDLVNDLNDVVIEISKGEII